MRASPNTGQTPRRRAVGSAVEEGRQGEQLSRLLHLSHPPGGQGKAMEQRSVLLVEDEPLLRELLATALESRGFFVHTAANAADAKRAFQRSDSPRCVDKWWTRCAAPSIRNGSDSWAIAPRIQQESRGDDGCDRSPPSSRGRYDRSAIAWPLRVPPRFPSGWQISWRRGSPPTPANAPGGRLPAHLALAIPLGDGPPAREGPSPQDGIR